MDGELDEFRKSVEMLEMLGSIRQPVSSSGDVCGCDDCQEYSRESRKTYLSTDAIRILEMRDKLGIALPYFFRIEGDAIGF